MKESSTKSILVCGSDGPIKLWASHKGRSGSTGWEGLRRQWESYIQREGTRGTHETKVLKSQDLAPRPDSTSRKFKTRTNFIQQERTQKARASCREGERARESERERIPSRDRDARLSREREKHAPGRGICWMILCHFSIWPSTVYKKIVHTHTQPPLR